MVSLDEERMYSKEQGEKSANPHLSEETLKRRKIVGAEKTA
jgi:hypothetical protein